MKATKRTTRRKYLVRATLLAGTGVMTTLTGITAVGVVPASASSSKVTLQFWNAYNTTDKEATTMQNVVLAKFEKENPGIKVQSPSRSRTATSWRKFIAAAAAGNPPALLRSDIAWVPTLAADGVLLNMSRSEVGQVRYLKGALARARCRPTYYHGSYYGIPDDTNTQVMFTGTRRSSPPPACPGPRRRLLSCGRTPQP
jgi:multiple sugar transport system substrate-binding protein